MHDKDNSLQIALSVQRSSSERNPASEDRGPSVSVGLRREAYVTLDEVKGQRTAE